MASVPSLWPLGSSYGMDFVSIASILTWYEITQKAVRTRTDLLSIPCYGTICQDGLSML
jgi:hypothetical protein